MPELTRHTIASCLGFILNYNDSYAFDIIAKNGLKTVRQIDADKIRARMAITTAEEEKHRKFFTEKAAMFTIKDTFEKICESSTS